jgi:hypothetical protein
MKHSHEIETKKKSLKREQNIFQAFFILKKLLNFLFSFLRFRTPKMMMTTALFVAKILSEAKANTTT